MGSVLIAYNDSGNLHDVFEGCADKVKEYCMCNGLDYNLSYPPNLNSDNVMEAMTSHQMCVIAAHGDCDSIQNENGDDVISTRTTNYNFKGKALYCISCYCGQNLPSSMQRIGLRLFVGYNSGFGVAGDISPFVESVMSGLSSFLSGNNVATSRNYMNSVFDEQIAILEEINPNAAHLLLHDKEHLVFEGDDDLVFDDLK